MSWLLLVLMPPCSDLGSDDWQTRELAQAKLNNPLVAPFLPKSHSNPEINSRLAAIHRKQSRWVSAMFWEQITRQNDYWHWFRVYVVNGTPDTDLYDLMQTLSGDQAKLYQMQELFPNPNGYPYISDIKDFEMRLLWHKRKKSFGQKLQLGMYYGRIPESLP